MATKKKESKAKDSKEVAEAKAAKKKARMEALKNRPAGQRPNSKQVDVITGENGTVVKNFGQVVKSGRNILGVLVTSVAYDAKGNIISTSTTFIPGELTIKAKKGHGNFSKPKHKGGNEEEEEVEEAEDNNSNDED